MSWSSNPVVTALIIGFIVVALAAGLARRKVRQRDGTRDSASWWLNSEADRRHHADAEAVSRDDPSVGTGDDGGGGGDSE